MDCMYKVIFSLQANEKKDKIMESKNNSENISISRQLLSSEVPLDMTVSLHDFQLRHVQANLSILVHIFSVSAYSML